SRLLRTAPTPRARRHTAPWLRATWATAPRAFRPRRGPDRIPRRAAPTVRAPSGARADRQVRPPSGRVGTRRGHPDNVPRSGIRRRADAPLRLIATEGWPGRKE